MMMKRVVLALTAMLLGGCGGESGEAAKAQPTAAASASVSCSDLPAFVQTYADAQISTCARGGSPVPNRESGTIIYTTAASSADVLAWYKTRAAESGLADNPMTGMGGGPMYGARDGQKRTFMAMTGPAEAGRTRVTLTWGRDLAQ